MRRLTAALALLLTLAGCRAAAAMPPTTVEDPTPPPPPLRDLGPAPELEGDIWLNSERPLRLKDLRGQVVLLEMWTFGCINCQRVIPHIRQWHQQYGDQGLEVIGNHYPEFAYEQDLGNLAEAVDRFQIEYPVVQDNQGINWRAYDNHYWPTTYLIDKQGHLRYQHIGEGAYETTEAAIQRLLSEGPSGQQ